MAKLKSVRLKQSEILFIMNRIDFKKKPELSHKLKTASNTSGENIDEIEYQRLIKRRNKLK